MTAPVVICDIETYHGYFLVAFKRVSDGRVVSIEISRRTDRTEDQKKRDRLRAIMSTHRVVTYNGMSYDVPLIWYCIEGANNAQLKSASDRIINGNVKYWEVEDLLGIRIPRIDHIDLIGVQPNAWASLKTLQGRLHGRKMQDLPIAPDSTLTDADMDRLTAYCSNDLDATHNLFDALRPALELREALGVEYGQNFMSKSDSQIGEAIVKKRVEKAIGEKVEKIPTAPGASFPYKMPSYLRFERSDLSDILEKLRTTEFFVQSNGKVELPPWLEKQTITIGESTYTMGIGGLHSTEANRAVFSDEDHQLIDQDATSFYPNIIIGSGLYPKSCGRSYLPVAKKMLDDRVIAKRNGDKVTAEGLKIALNGALFGKGGSPYSVLYAPHLMITVTLTGQLVLLMLIERAEAAGIPVVSANTDGIVFRCPREKLELLQEVSRQWETETGFQLEATPYKALYSQSVNTYIAIKEDGKAKRKGSVSNPRADNDMRGQLMKNPQMDICSDAVVAYLTKGTEISDYIRSAKDVRDFVTVVNVKGGGTYRGDYLGKVVRYFWSTDGAEILYKTPHPTTGNHKKVSSTDGCRPLMELPDTLPADIDYERYIQEAREILMDIGANTRPAPVKPLRLFRYNAIGWFAVAAA